MMSRFLVAMMLMMGGASISLAAKGNHDAHSKGEIVVTAKINKIISYENGMSLVLDRDIAPNESCVHLENAASFETSKLEKIESAKAKGSSITLKIADGHVVDVM